MSNDINGDSEAFSLDDLGIVAEAFKDLGLVEMLNQRLPRYDIRRIISSGNAVLALF